MSIMQQINYPNMVELKPEQRDWLEWMFADGDGRKFLDWSGVDQRFRDELATIYVERKYDEANDKSILNDMRGLYREWSKNTGIRWERVKWK